MTWYCRSSHGEAANGRSVRRGCGADEPVSGSGQGGEQRAGRRRRFSTSTGTGSPLVRLCLCFSVPLASQGRMKADGLLFWS
jgi:hypothetical protein